jgi:hypothetical protein
VQQDEQLERMVPWRAPLAARVSVQVIAGLVFGAGTGYLGTIVGGWLVEPEPGGLGDIVAMLGGMLLGFPLGAGVGVWFSGRLLGGQGALWRTLLGAYLGVGIGLIGARLLVYGNTSLGWLLLIALCLLGAGAGYYAQRRRSSR